MTNQPTLFGGSDAYGGHLTPVPIPVRAANGDPATSHEAAERASRSGKVARHRAIEVERVRVVEHALVAVGRRPEQEHPLIARDHLVANLDVAGRHSTTRLDG